MNFFQRRIAFLVFLSLLYKASTPSASWAQIAMFGGLAFAMWQLRSAVFRACMERLLNTAIFYVCDALCVVLLFVAYRTIFFEEMGFVIPLVAGLVIALFPAYRYRKRMKFIRAAMEQQAVDAAEKLNVVEK